MPGSKAAFALLGAVCLVAACQKPQNYPQPIAPEVVGLSPRAGFDTKRVVSKNVIALRSVTRVAEGKGADKFTEVVGAKCLLSSPEYTVRFTTPSNVVFPEIHGKPGNLTLACEKGKKKSDPETVEPRLDFRQTTLVGGGSGSAAMAGLVVSIIANGIAHDVAKNKDNWQYKPKELKEILIEIK